MDRDELQALATRTRFMREAGVAIILGSVVLSLFLLIPKHPPQTAAVTASLPPTPNAFANLSLSAKAAIVYDLSSHQTLFSYNPDAQLPLASLTKLLTVYAALKTLGPNAVVTISRGDAELDAPRAFKGGESFQLANLARLTLTGSLNDGAAALVEAASNQQGVSANALLAGTASALGLASTYALNGNGLDLSTEVSGGYGSAHDIALLAGALVAHYPDIANATTNHTISQASLTGKSYTAVNTNPDVVEAPRLLLSKTGYTDLAGGNLVEVFDAGLEHPVAIVVLGSTKDARFTDVNALVDSTLAHFAGLASL